MKYEATTSIECVDDVAKDVCVVVSLGVEGGVGEVTRNCDADLGVTGNTNVDLVPESLRTPIRTTALSCNSLMQYLGRLLHSVHSLNTYMATAGRLKYKNLPLM